MTIFLQLVPPFEKGGPGGIFTTRTRKSPSIPLFQRGKRSDRVLGKTSSTHISTPPFTNVRDRAYPSYRRRPVSRGGGVLATKMDAGLRRHDEQGYALEGE